MKNIIRDLENEIKDLKRNRNTNAYYYYDLGHLNNISYNQGLNYQKTYNSTYNAGHYYYDENFGYTYKPSWVNPNLNPGLERDIYIR